MLRVLPVLPLIRSSTSTLYARLRARAVSDWRPVGRIHVASGDYTVVFNDGARAFASAWAAAGSSSARPDSPSVEMAVVISGDFVLVAAVACALVDSRDERAVHDGGLHHLPGGPAPLRSRWPAIISRT